MPKNMAKSRFGCIGGEKGRIELRDLCRTGTGVC